MKIEVGKQYKTRNGKRVRIYATDTGSEEQMIHGAWEYAPGLWFSAGWYEDGSYDSDGESVLDIVDETIAEPAKPASERPTLWVVCVDPSDSTYMAYDAY